MGRERKGIPARKKTRMKPKQVFQQLHPMRASADLSCVIPWLLSPPVLSVACIHHLEAAQPVSGIQIIQKLSIVLKKHWRITQSLSTVCIFYLMRASFYCLHLFHLHLGHKFCKTKAKAQPVTGTATLTDFHSDIKNNINTLKLTTTTSLEGAMCVTSWGS